MKKIRTGTNSVKGSSSETPQRITWGYKLATGYDRLKIGFYVKWDRFEILDTLAEAKQAAVEAHEPVPVSMSDNGDLVFNCHPNGRKGGYAYHLSRTDVSIFFSRRKDSTTPNVWVDIGSCSCWSPGHEYVISEVERLIKHMGGHIIKNSISEVHLCADFIGLDIKDVPINIEEHWITRANLFSSYKNRSRKSGMTYAQDEGWIPKGSRKTVLVRDIAQVRETGIVFGAGDIMLRIYDKVLEIERNRTKQSLFNSVWDIEDLNETSVTRVEFQLRRVVLKQMRINTLKDLEKKKTGLWRYCTQEWTRLSSRAVDRKNRHQDRSELHPWWLEVQKIDFCGQEIPALNRKKVKSAKNIEGLTDMMAGIALSVGTISNRKHDDLEGVIAFAQGYLENRIRRMHREKADNGQNLFEQKMKRRWAEIWPLGFIPEPT